jgi:hypothetical protein
LKCFVSSTPDISERRNPRYVPLPMRVAAVATLSSMSDTRHYVLDFRDRSEAADLLAGPLLNQAARN